ncbi:pheromone autoinducer 2 transporter [Microbacterium azadirachtae]|uniref:Pheromone autoinducer 2 transporter n=1 Tax=Microbacterium azadirachtae TaxID=582680 RepID=A0A0F0LFU1_9MICO|nr:AI-2E family transporter [Microbacterium azadirachtae]KJL31998.1 pheromone autoinducer 2 transporter [Microbacterium azadirachtae]
MTREDRTPEEAAEDTAATPAGPAENAGTATATADSVDDADAVPPVTFVEAGPPRASFWTRIDKPVRLGFLVTLGGLLAILLGLSLGSLSTVLIYIAFALFAALGLDPAVRWLEKRGLSRAWSVVAVIVALALVLVVIVLAILPTVIDQIATFVTGIPHTIRNFTHTDFYAWLENQFGVGLTDLVTEVQKFLSDPSRIAQIGGGALQIGTGIATGIATGVSGGLIVLVLTLYFLATLPSMKAGLLRLAPARDRRSIDRISEQITESVGGYVMGMVGLAFINAMIVFLLYLVLGLPFPPLMATVAFLITLIPLVGSVLFWIIGTGIALFSSPLMALIFAAVYVVYMQIEAYVITPRVMSKAIAIPGSLVVIGALVGGTLLGLLGALIAVPVTASILIIVKQVWIPRQDARI